MSRSDEEQQDGEIGNRPVLDGELGEVHRGATLMLQNSDFLSVFEVVDAGRRNPFPGLEAAGNLDAMIGQWTWGHGPPLHGQGRFVDQQDIDGAGLAGADCLLVDDVVAELQPPVENLGVDQVDNLDRGADLDRRLGRRSQDKGEADHEDRQQAIQFREPEQRGGGVTRFRHGIRSVFFSLLHALGGPSRPCCVFPGLKRKYYT